MTDLEQAEIMAVEIEEFPEKNRIKAYTKHKKMIAAKEEWHKVNGGQTNHEKRGEKLWMIS